MSTNNIARRIRRLAAEVEFVHPSHRSILHRSPKALKLTNSSPLASARCQSPLVVFGAVAFGTVVLERWCLKQRSLETQFDLPIINMVMVGDTCSRKG